MAVYNTDPRLQQFLRYIRAVSLVPVEDITKVWTEIIEEKVPEVEDDVWPNVEPGDLDQFVSYVVLTWVGGVNRRTGKRQNP